MIFMAIKAWRRWLAVILALISAIALSSCNPDQFKTKAAQVPQFVFVTPSSPATFNYPLNQSLFSIFGYIYDGLITQNGITAAVEPALAESWEISADKKRIVFTLKDNLKWSDGQPLTVDDVLFTYQDIYLNPKIPTDIKDILRIGNSRAFPTIKKLDQRRIEFIIPEPFAPFLRFVGGLPILPAHALRESVYSTGSDGNPKFISTWGTDTDPKAIIGNSAYRIESYIPSERVILRRNPYYWRKDAQGNPQPYIERIVLQIIESTDNQLINFRSGQLDSLDLPPEGFPLLKREEKRGRFKIYNGGPDPSTLFVNFNLNKARNSKDQPVVDPIKSRWFNTLAFRQAVAYAIDRNTMKTNIFRGLGDIQNSPVQPQSPYYLSPEKGLKVYNYNPEKAKQLLLNAGFKYNPQGKLLDAEGNQVRFTMLVKAEEKSRVDMAILIKQNLSQIGIQADLQVLNFNSILDKLENRSWECYVGGFGGGGVDPHSGANIWSSQGRLHQFNQGPQPGSPPIKGWEVSDWEQEIDRLFIEGARELDETKRKAIYAQFQQIVQEQLPLIYLPNKLSFEAVRDRVQGVKYSTLGGAFWNLYELKVSEK
ncbi:MAG: ABC transporter substrate-binding protein [Aphanothece sp. CMT-3BRIN-NPC111]|jgi:peptide/nickel transport system substrate-binding protein|nr:ABC transporter substrate-binding protein [Aphanothece sp. CMT-3BRIN-NPC111]